MSNNVQTRFFLPDVLVTEMLKFVWGITACELRSDLDFYIQWRKHVPPMFLEPSTLETRFWYNVANPLCRYHPYHPRKYLSLRPSDIWSASLPALGSMLCREKVRMVKTYKRCIMRWISDCITNRHIFFWFVLIDKVFKRINFEHFRVQVPSSFVQESLREIAFCIAS